VLDFDAASNPARIVNNAEWLTRLSAIDFMRDIGKHFSVNAMLAKDSVRRRIDGEEGISYTEFSYSLLQAYDFLELSRRYGCSLQMGGSDQWGNITAGMDLIRRLDGAKAYGLVLPLVTTASGTKFGKTEAGTIWLDPARTSPFEFFQFWLNIDDADAGKYLKFFTFLPQPHIEALEASARREPSSGTRSASWRARSRAWCTGRRRCARPKRPPGRCSRETSGRARPTSCAGCSATCHPARSRSTRLVGVWSPCSPTPA
jgi:tyrosyl-tRNA synthetase